MCIKNYYNIVTTEKKNLYLYKATYKLVELSADCA